MVAIGHVYVHASVAHVKSSKIAYKPRYYNVHVEKAEYVWMKPLSSINYLWNWVLNLQHMIYDVSLSHYILKFIFEVPLTFKKVQMYH